MAIAGSVYNVHAPGKTTNAAREAGQPGVEEVQA
jgi:hypothetical protein